MKNMSVFGDFINNQLMDKNMSLRALSRATGIDVSNLSKMERGIIYPPQKAETLQKIADGLCLTDDEKKNLFGLASLVNGKFPDDLKEIKKNKTIPLLLRAIDNKKLTDEQIEKLIQVVEKENDWQGRIVD